MFMPVTILANLYVRNSVEYRLTHKDVIYVYTLESRTYFKNKHASKLKICYSQSLLSMNYCKPLLFESDGGRVNTFSIWFYRYTNNLSKH